MRLGDHNDAAHACWAKSVEGDRPDLHVGNLGRAYHDLLHLFHPADDIRVAPRALDNVMVPDRFHRTTSSRPRRSAWRWSHCPEGAVAVRHTNLRISAMTPVLITVTRIALTSVPSARASMA